ncbi:MAG: ATP-binding protein [Candidatus Korobacteraceae bacterium]|jgi:PAS domain S-box-containing protein
MRLPTALSIYAPENRTRLLFLAAVLVVVIALVDWQTAPYISLGFLYLFPIMIAGGFLSRTKIVSLAVLCSLLQEEFSNLPPADAVTRLVLSSAGFVGTGLFISELLWNRRIVLTHVQELENQVQLRREAEEQLRALVESSPAAIITVDSEGDIVLANEAAHHLLASAGQQLSGSNVRTYLPALLAALQSRRPQGFRTSLQCRGKRSNGEVFLAGVWFSTYPTLSGNRLAAIIVDLSEDLRNREDLNLDYLLKNTRILMSAVSHEIRNLCGAALVVHKNLTRVNALQGNADFEALGTLIQGLEKLSSMELRSPAEQARSAIELTPVLDELRVLLESAYHEADMELGWAIEDSLPLVWADRYGLMQVFLNLAKNSRRAMQDTAEKRLTIRTTTQDESVVLRFEDTGSGIVNPENLFRPFQRDAQATGLGLYVSRALVKSFGGDLVYEPRERGCCFAVVLQAVIPAKGEADA